MTLEQRSMWLSERFTLNHLPEWPCPYCKANALKLDSQTIYDDRISQSQLEPNDDDQFNEGRFCCLLRCIKCDAVISLVGRCFSDFTAYSTGDPNEPPTEIEKQFEPFAFTDAPPIIHVPSLVPVPVIHHLRRAFSLFWNDREASANAIRCAVERLLTHQGVPTESQDGKRARLVLSDRIKLFSKTSPDLGEILSAVKWPTNVGSHGNPLTRGDLIDLFEQTEYFLEELYEGKHSRLKSTRDKLNQLKAPLSGDSNESPLF